MPTPNRIPSGFAADGYIGTLHNATGDLLATAYFSDRFPIAMLRAMADEMIKAASPHLRLAIYDVSTGECAYEISSALAGR